MYKNHFVSNKKKHTRIRAREGITLVEAAAALALLLPLLVVVIFVIIEATKAYEISRDLQIGAELGARALATNGSTTTGVQQQQILSNITVGNTVVDPSQFYNVVWNQDDNPPSVTVFVQYKSTGPKQPPPFPNPDPLNLGANFIMKSQSTYRLQH